MKIAFIGTHGIPARYGGAETAVQEISNILVQQSFKILVIGCVDTFSIEFKHYKGVEIINIPKFPIRSIDFVLRGMISTILAIIKGYNVFHYFGEDAGFYFAFAKLLNKRAVVTIDGLPRERESYSETVKIVLDKFLKFSLDIVDVKVVDSQFAKKQIETLSYKDINYIPYGAKVGNKCDMAVLNKFNLSQKDYYIFVGRLVEEKKVHVLIEGFVKSHSSKKLVIIGKNHYNSKYEKNLRNKASSEVIFLGAIYGYEYEELCKGAFAYVTASGIEGSSPSLIQAMGFSLPVIVSDIQQNIEVIDNSGLSFKKDNSDDLASKILLLEKDKDLYHLYSVRALNRVKELFSWDIVANKYKKIYEELYEIHKKNSIILLLKSKLFKK